MSYFKLKFSKNISYQFKYSVQTETIQILSDYDKSLVYFQIMTKSHAPLTSLRSEKHNYLLARRLFRDKTVPFSSDVMCHYVSRFLPLRPHPPIQITSFRIHYRKANIPNGILPSFLPEPHRKINNISASDQASPVEKRKNQPVVVVDSHQPTITIV